MADKLTSKLAVQGEIVVCLTQGQEVKELLNTHRNRSGFNLSLFYFFNLSSNPCSPFCGSSPFLTASGCKPLTYRFNSLRQMGVKSAVSAEISPCKHTIMLWGHTIILWGPVGDTHTHTHSRLRVKELYSN